MFLASESRPGRSEYFWPGLVRLGVGLVIILSLLLEPQTILEEPGMLVAGGLFSGWGLLMFCAGKFWRASARILGTIAFVDLIFSSAVVIFCHGVSLVWLLALFLLPGLELSSLWGIAGIAFVLIAFIWTIILTGLMNLTLFRQPLWWIVPLLWGTFILFTATLQAMRLGYIRPSVLWVRKQIAFTTNRDEQPKPVSEEDHWKPASARSAGLIAQSVAAFELSFRRMGVQTEGHRQEIENALSVLYSCDGDAEALSRCLDRLLQAAKQNWVGLAAFSPREQEILELLLQNCTYKEMGFRLHVSPSTIKTHIYHVFQKLNVSNREEAMDLIRARGWFSSGSHLSLAAEVRAV